MTEQLTREQAEACLLAVQNWICDPHTGGTAKLYEPGFHCDGWAIVMDHGPQDWPWHVSQEDIWPDGVFVQAGSHWYLGLYPA